jgi:hypothetical protein
MSNHNLFVHGDGVAERATTEQILAAARQALAYRVRRGADISSPIERVNISRCGSGTWIMRFSA